MRASVGFSFVLNLAGVVLNAVAGSQGAPVQPDQIRGVAVGGTELTEDSCEVLASTQGKKPELREVPGMHVLDRTEAAPLVLKSIPDVKISAIVCWRSEARLAPNDYLVPHSTGLPLYIKTDTGNEATDRTIALEIVSGSLRVHLVRGPAWSPAEGDEMKQALAVYNKRVAGGA